MQVIVSSHLQSILLYRYLKKGALLTVESSRPACYYFLFNPWATYAKAAACGALGDAIQAGRYARLLRLTFPFGFLRQRLAKYLGRTQPLLVRELLGPVTPKNSLRIAFELVEGTHASSLGLGGYKPSGLHAVLCHNRLAPSAVGRVDSVNQLLHTHGCTPVQWASQQPVPLAYVATSVAVVVQAPAAVAGPLVTVLVTAYNGGAYVGQALQTLLAQTHANLQILVANDASTDETWAHLSALKGVDERLHIFNLPRNVGTYAAKSLLLQFAQGEYVVCHDSDDVADPTFVATSLTALQADARRVAVISNWFRVDEELRIFPGAVRRFWPLLSINHSSLMLRTAVLRQLGGWDVPRVAADTELFERVRAIYGKRAVYQLTQPLTIGSLRSDSLMNDPQVGAMQTEAFRRRVEYREAWVQWHEQCKKHGIKPTMTSPFDPDRPFSVPDEFKVCPDDIATNFESMKSQTYLPWSPSSGA
jgi:hypothetical protein